jgi:target of rapamycin complex subunit LST8
VKTSRIKVGERAFTGVCRRQWARSCWPLQVLARARRPHSRTLGSLVASRAYSSPLTRGARAGYDHTIKFWEAPSGICIKSLNHPESQVNKLEISPDKTHIAAAGNPSLRIFDIATGTATSYEGHTNNVTAVGYHRDGKWFFTGSEDGTIKIWDVRAPGCQREYESSCPFNSVALHPNQAELISGDRDGNIRVWDLKQNACSAELVPDGNKAIRCVSVAHDATLLAAANDQGSVFVWRLGSQQDASNPKSDDRSTKFEPLQKLQAHSTYITKCLLSPDCKRLATTSSDHSVKIWDTANNFREEKTLSGHQRWVWDAVFSADSAYLVTASSDQTARLWDVAQGETIRHYTGHHKAVICVALHDRPAGEPS